MNKIIFFFAIATFSSLSLKAQEKINWISLEKAVELQKKTPKKILIDMYTVWCGPCKMLAPILETLSEEYKGAIDIYKIDTEAEQELAAAFGIRSIPSMLFCPMEGQPEMANGALPKAELERIIADVLKVEKPV